jgi:hypothetical protein
LFIQKVQLFPLEILDFFNEFLKSGIRWNEPLHYLTTHTSLSPIRHGCAPGFVNYKKGALNSQPQVIQFTSSWQLLAHGWWFSPASSTAKTPRHSFGYIKLYFGVFAKLIDIKICTKFH